MLSILLIVRKRMGLRGLVFLPLPKLLWMHNSSHQLAPLLYRNSPRLAFGRPAIARLVAMSATNTNTNTSSSTKTDCEQVQQQPHPVSVQARPPQKVLVPKIDFCPSCGGATKQQIPDGEEMPRAVCTLCGKIHYQNPKMVVGCLVEHEDKVLLCKRNIEPSHGLWTLPAGFMELGESAAEGAARETWEEANAEVEVLSPFAQFDIPLIGQSYIIFRGRFKRLHFSPGPESLECSLFKLDEIPFEKLAFSSIFITLQLYAKDIKDGVMRIHYGVIEKRLGASPSDPQGFVLRDYMCSNSNGSSLSPV